MNTHHQVVEEHVISNNVDSDGPSPEVIDTANHDSLKRNYQVDQIYSVPPMSQYQIIPANSIRGDNTYEGQLNLSPYLGPAYILTTAADGTQQLQPLQEHVGAQPPQIQIKNVDQVEEIAEVPVVTQLIEDVPANKINFPHVLKKNRPFKCDQCTASYLDVAELEEHKSKHTDDGPFTCVDCHFTFMFKSHYRSHRTRCEKKRAERPSTKPYIVECRNTKHKFPKNSIKKTQSSQEMVYLSMSSLHSSSRINSGPKQSSSTRFNPKNPTFKRTKRTGRSDRPFECDECDATFKVDSDLKNHKMKHTGEGPFKCEECEFVFLFRKLYESHQRRCRKKRPDLFTSKKPECNETNDIQPSANEPRIPETVAQLEVASTASCSSNYVAIQSPMPVYSQPTIIEMRPGQTSEVLQMPHSVFGTHNVATTSNSKQDVKYELLPSVELDGMSMNQIVNLIKVKGPSQ